MPDLDEQLASYRGNSYVIAPAGFGKTHLIAKAVGRYNGKRQLVLTHTYAGVHALRKKMRELSVPTSAYQLDTIASWTLRLSLSYSQTSGWINEHPRDTEWGDLYAACTSLLDRDFIRRIISASYDGMYVDEYQDCSVAQHNLVLKLSRNFPTRVLGDPLQSIFNFDGQTSVNWMRDVESNFNPLGCLNTPYRWNLVGADDIGQWLVAVRGKLESGQSVDLRQGLPDGVTFKASNDDSALFISQGNTCRHFMCSSHETVIAIHKGEQAYKAKCHTLAKSVSGKFSSIEEVEGKSLFSFFNKMAAANTNKARLKELIEFAGKCMTSVNTSLSAATRRGEAVTLRVNTPNRSVAEAANAYLADTSSNHMKHFLLSLKAVKDVRVVRADLFNRAIGVLRKHVLHPELSLTEATQKYQSEFRFKGRPVGHRKLIGTTLLVKGLEFDHAIVLDASSLSRNELYVALTRGSKTLTILSRQPVLNSYV